MSRITKNRLAKNLLLTAAVVLLGALPAAWLHAGDNIETVTGGGTVISHELWAPSAFPLPWLLHEDGIVNNNSVGAGTPPVSNAAAVAELSAAFQSWEAVPTSDITVAYAGETPIGDSGCDLQNIATWSDTNITFPVGAIAAGLATSYVGPDIVLNAGNRTVACGTGTVMLPVADYPNGMTLTAGTILDMDMTWNANGIDYVTTPNTTFSVVDIQAVAAHEFGHMFGFSHTSLAYTASNPATMFPIVSSQNIALQNNVRTLAQDDVASSGRGYPDTGFYPTGVAPYTTGAITGRVTQPNGTGATGVRLWAYDTASLNQPIYETFTATQFDFDPALDTGDYVLDGLEPGDYYVCILPWSNNVPTAQSSDPLRYNLTTSNGTGNTGFPTECYDDHQPGTPAPGFGSSDLIRTVTVTAGATTPNIDFVTGSQTSDFVLVMDRSGSMLLPSGNPGTNKLEALQDSAHAFIDYLDLAGNHRLGLVQFQQNLVPLVPVFDLQSLTAGTVANAHAAVTGMSAGGVTNIIAGVDEAVDQLTTIAGPNPRQVVMLFSDGKHNWPFGSDLNDIGPPLLANDLTFYSVGFGTNVDDVILTDVALSTGGVHVNEQALDPLALGKHFLSIAASAADETTLIDPRYTLGYGQTATLNTAVDSDDQHLSFVVHWPTRDRDRFRVTVTTPNGCAFNTDAPPSGAAVRRGDTYQVVRVPLPLSCGSSVEHSGVWSISATNLQEQTEEVEILIFGRSPIELFAEVFMDRDGKTPLVSARLLNRGKVREADRIWGQILVPLEGTDDSTDQDQKGRDWQGPKPQYPPRGERTIDIYLYDDGKDGDDKAGDGIFTARLPLVDKGAHHLRVVADYTDKLKSQREFTLGFYFDGSSILTPKGSYK